MANITVSTDIDNFMQAADNAAAQLSLGLGTAATTAATAYATAAQGATADTAIQPGDAATLASIQVGGGATITSVLIATGSAGTASVAAGTYTNIDITVTGAADGDFASVNTSGTSLITNGSVGLVISEIAVTTDKVTMVIFNTDLVAPHSLNNQALKAIVFKA